MPYNDDSIGIFDSGFGGLTVMNAIREILPCENIIYFGDTARIPYGTKSQETILRYAIENTSFLINQNIKVLVVACHTASCLTLPKLQELFPIPIIGVTQSCQITHLPSTNKLAILGTHATINSGIYQNLILKQFPQLDITAIACQLFVNLVEEGFIDHPLTDLAIHEYLRPLKENKIDTILLGCTHFPLLSLQIERYLSRPITFVDPALSCAQAVRKLLTNLNLLRSLPNSTSQFYVSDAPEKFQALGQKFFSDPITNVYKTENFTSKKN